MNKNVKFLGATAAALLAVAPIATPVAVSAAEVVTPEATAAPAALASTVKANDTSVAAGNKVNSVLGGISFSNATIVGKAAISADATAVAGQTYEQIVKVTLQTTKANQRLNFSGATVYDTEAATTSIKNITTGDDKLAVVYVKRIVTGYSDADALGTPFFTNSLAKDGQYASFEVMDLVNGNGSGYKVTDNELNVGVTATLTQITAKLNKLLADDGTLNNIKVYVGSSSDTLLPASNYTLTKAQVKAQLEEQGFTVKGEKVTVDADHNDFNLTLTATNPLNKENTASVIIPATFGYSDVDNYPVFNMKAGQGIQNVDGKVLTGSGLSLIKRGDIFLEVPQSSTATFNPYDYITSINASTGNASFLEKAGTTNDVVDLSTPGVYTVQYKATNSNGYTTVVNFEVTVKANTTLRYVNYVPGYGINTWNIAGNNAVFTGNRILHGTEVILTSKVPETKTINGVEFTKIYTDSTKTSTVWVESQYLSMSKPGNGSTAVSGTLKVKSGYGLVHLTSVDGEFQEKAVNPGSSWKFVATKTVNGEKMYKIGSNKEWIMAKYVDVI